MLFNHCTHSGSCIEGPPGSRLQYHPHKHHRLGESQKESVFVAESQTRAFELFRFGLLMFLLLASWIQCVHEEAPV